MSIKNTLNENWLLLSFYLLNFSSYSLFQTVDCKPQANCIIINHFTNFFLLSGKLERRTSTSEVEHLDPKTYVLLYHILWIRAQIGDQRFFIYDGTSHISSLICCLTLQWYSNNWSIADATRSPEAPPWAARGTPS